jgi:hypothetical protein
MEKLFNLDKINEQINKNKEFKNGYNIGIYEDSDCYSYCLAQNFEGTTNILLSKIAFCKSDITQLKEDVLVLQRIFEATIFEEV